jgi:hypothetical protein
VAMDRWQTITDFTINKGKWQRVEAQTNPICNEGCLELALLVYTCAPELLLT